MRKLLTELNPKWISLDNEIIGLHFTCPIDGDDCPSVRLAVYWKHPKGINWQKQGETFENITISPSLDATKSGCKFHGWVKHGWVEW